MFLILIDQIHSILQMIERVASEAKVSNVYVETLLKIIGIAYIAEFGAQITKDAGQGAIASKIELLWENLNSRYGNSYFDGCN